MGIIRFAMLIRQQLPQYAALMRLDRPIGILLLLWPTLWALWLANLGHPNLKILSIFMIGVILMRSAGCIINDVADRHLDKYVRRCKDRPLAAGKVTKKEALFLFFLLTMSAFFLVLNTNILTIELAFLALVFAILYPFLKRLTHLPQLGLGLAFSSSVPMAFAASVNEVTLGGWFLFLTSAVWPLIYDTMYAMVDREDDLKVGVKSAAILFDDMDRIMIALLQLLFLTMLIIIGLMFRLRAVYYFGLIIVGILFCYQQWLIKDRNPSNCMQAFTNNNLVGMSIFLGIFCSYWPTL